MPDKRQTTYRPWDRPFPDDQPTSFDLTCFDNWADNWYVQGGISFQRQIVFRMAGGQYGATEATADGGRYVVMDADDARDLAARLLQIADVVDATTDDELRATPAFRADPLGFGLTRSHDLA